MVKISFSIPNLMTLFRVMMIPVLILLLREPSDAMFRAAFYLFVFAAITDYFDGLIARAFGNVSDFGKLMDPIADKILVISTLVMLVAIRDPLYGDSWVPAWMVVLVIVREIWVTGLRGVAATAGLVVAAGASGKVKSFLQMFAIGAFLLNDFVLDLGVLQLPARFVGLNCMLISLFFSYWGAVQYTQLVFGWNPEEESAQTTPQDPQA
jgi:CDP-diacylglycerol--glycerol-3-phosphate 3-phosphatidyltransferase